MKIKRLLANAFTVGSFTALSRVLGLVREMLQSRLVGAGVAQSAFTLAFALPNMARKLFGEGALTAAFVPVFKSVAESEGREAAERLSRAVMTSVLLLLAAIAALAATGTCSALALSGKFAFSERTQLTLHLVSILLPYMLAICGAAFGMGVLNAMGRFKAAGFVASILNIVWIAALSALAFFPSLTAAQKTIAISWAILGGGAAQFGYMAWRMKRAGISPAPRFAGWKETHIRLVWRNMWIAAAGSGAIQLNYLLDQALAQAAAPWAAGVVGYAERLMDLPLGVVGVAFGTVLLPAFSGFFAKGDAKGAKEAMASALSSLMFVMIPASVGLAVLSREVTAAIYQGGEFDATATMRVSRALAVYSAGLCLFSLQKVLTPFFQAQGDMKTPVRVTFATVALNATLNIVAVWMLPEEWRHVGLAASTVACAGAGCAMLWARARRRNGPLGLGATFARASRHLLAAGAMGAVLAALRPLAAARVAPLAGAAGDVASLAFLILAGMATYGAACFILKK